METKSKQLEVCRTCAGFDCATCSDNKYIKEIKKNLSSIYNLAFTSEQPFFGKEPCECCGDALGGLRRQLIGTTGKKHNTPRIDLTCCVDCFGFLFA